LVKAVASQGLMRSISGCLVTLPGESLHSFSAAREEK